MTSRGRRDWELGGLYTEAGHLGRPVLTRGLFVPNHIELLKGALWWDVDVDRPISEPTPGPGMLAEFVTLHERPDARILDYARRWGVLHTCIHQLPCRHAPRVGSDGGVVGCDPVGYRTHSVFIAASPLDRWRHFAQQAAAILRVAAHLHAGEPGRPEDWHAIFQESARQAPWWKRTVNADRLQLASVVTEWMTLGAVEPMLVWHGTAPTLTFGSRGGGSLDLFGALACQLLVAVARVASVAVCAGCGCFHSPRRRPPARRRSYCRDCARAGVPQRHAQADHRRRVRAGVSEHSADLTLPPETDPV